MTDAINQLNEKQEVIAYDFEGKRYDLGDKRGFVKATVDFALNREDMRNDILLYLESIVGVERVVN